MLLPLRLVKVVQQRNWLVQPAPVWFPDTGWTGGQLMQACYHLRSSIIVIAGAARSAIDHQLPASVYQMNDRLDIPCDPKSKRLEYECNLLVRS
jgi:hypothetical protein